MRNPLHVVRDIPVVDLILIDAQFLFKDMYKHCKEIQLKLFKPSNISEQIIYIGAFNLCIDTILRMLILFKRFHKNITTTFNCNRVVIVNNLKSPPEQASINRMNSVMIEKKAMNVFQQVILRSEDTSDFIEIDKYFVNKFPSEYSISRCNIPYVIHESADPYVRVLLKYISFDQCIPKSDDLLMWWKYCLEQIDGYCSCIVADNENIEYTAALFVGFNMKSIKNTYYFDMSDVYAPFRFCKRKLRKAPPSEIVHTITKTFKLIDFFDIIKSKTIGSQIMDINSQIIMMFNEIKNTYWNNTIRIKTDELDDTLEYSWMLKAYYERKLPEILATFNRLFMFNAD
jgi:hypothetical protein